MNERTFAIIVLCVAGIAVGYAIIGRMLGFHRPIPWSGGGHSTLAGELAFAGFFGCIGLLVVVSPVFIIPCLACWLIASRSQANANRQFAREEQELRERNAKEHPGVFDHAPPQLLGPDATPFVDVYDSDSCVFIGRTRSTDICDLIQATADMPDQGPNDIFVIEEMVEPPALPVSSGLQSFLQPHFDLRGHVVLRWLPVGESK